ncbi:mitogen-activated protein kinase-binding protein 1-like isoform X2 [Gouania willdenowi]|uniref:mitogen-activated protein kinase-binding protein 1-like isoform X2 n=1 Tax=Gouania willdenowi TaxID=441366 RepID=UPI0010559F9D|nr:mitogen-activated protein kinase-binding protein 1-like isoform X2 [Gouania willdenowi]
MPGEGLTIKGRIRRLLRSPSATRRKNSKESLSTKVTLEKILGITASGNRGLACDPRCGLVAYPAGCVVVLLNPKNNRQHHIINSSRKTITTLSFSPDGRHLVTGESGHLPAVRLWDVAERRQVAELPMHKYGISCVAFSPNGKYIVSVGNQHDMMVNVWAWKKDVVVATNKVSSKVTSVSFSEDSSYFVTVGNRHVKFWYLDQCKASKASDPVPLLGRSGLLGELRNNLFCDVACGRGAQADSTFCITSSGLMCELNGKRMLEKWVDLQTAVAQTLSLSEDLIFCGCADGTVRAFDPADLRFVCTLPRPHPLGSDVSAMTEAGHLFTTINDARYPDTIALSYDPVNQWLSCVYNDHSMYVWDVRDVHRVGKLHSALFHASCVWDLEMFPDVPGNLSGAFLTCSADNTVRLWRIQDWAQVNSQNILSSDLLNIMYIDENKASLVDVECTANANTEKAADVQTAEIRSGIRTICVSPDGKHLASGDRNGMLRVHDLSTKEEILKVEAHDAEILCLEYSKPETGLKLLATASRDRLIHVLDAADDYGLMQTLDQHSSSITAVRFATNDNKVRMISCGADKSIYFHTAHQTDGGTEFRRSHHMVRKTTLYDMGVDVTCKYAAVGCQDRCIRVFNISSGKQKRVYKGSLGEEGSLLRVQIDPSGQYVAASCSDKNISIFDFYTGECVAAMFGHSEIVTGMKFTNDCKHLITVSGDSCIFVWRLAPELTISMRERLCQLRQNPNSAPRKACSLRREVHSSPTLATLSSDSDPGHEEEVSNVHTPSTGSDSSPGDEDTGGSDEGQQWKMTKVSSDCSKRPRRRWSHRMGSLELMVKSMLDLRQLDTSVSKKDLHDVRGTSSSLQDPLSSSEERPRRPQSRPHTAWLSSYLSKDMNGLDGGVLYPEDDTTLPCSDYMVKEQQRCRTKGPGNRSESQDSCSPDSTSSIGYCSRESSPDYFLEDSAAEEYVSPDSSEDEEEEEEEQVVCVASVDEALRAVTDASNHSPEDFLRQNFETLAENCSTAQQSRVPRLSMTSRFLAKGQNNRSATLFTKANGKEQGGHSAKPLVSTVRPLMEGAEKEQHTHDTTETPGTPEKECPPKFKFLKKKNSGPHIWKQARSPTKAARGSSLHKSHSVQNLSTDSSSSLLPSSDSREFYNRPHQLFLDRDTRRPSLHLSSPSSGSPQSPRSPMPWESPRLKPHHSYMNPTASSMAKSSRSSSLVDGIYIRTPPRSPCISKGSKSSDELDAETPLLTPSPTPHSPSSISSSSPLSSSSLSNSPPPTPTTISFTHNPPPSRIPLPKQPLSPRRSLGPEVRPCGGLSRTLTPDSGCNVTSNPGLGHARVKLSLRLDASPSSLLPKQQKEDAVSESTKRTNQTGDAEHSPALNPQSDCSVTEESCRQAVTDLHCSLRKTIVMYTTLQQSLQQPAEDHQKMKNILSEALFAVKSELNSLPRPASQCEGLPGDNGATAALLEQYAELLLKSVEKRLDTKALLDSAGGNS